MEDLSKRTVSILLIIAVILTIIFTWSLLSNKEIVVVQGPSEQPPAGSGQVRLQIGSTNAALPASFAEGGSVRLLITGPKGG